MRMRLSSFPVDDSSYWVIHEAAMAVIHLDSSMCFIMRAPFLCHYVD